MPKISPRPAAVKQEIDGCLLCQISSSCFDVLESSRVFLLVSVFQSSRFILILRHCS